MDYKNQIKEHLETYRGMITAEYGRDNNIRSGAKNLSCTSYGM